MARVFGRIRKTYLQKGKDMTKTRCSHLAAVLCAALAAGCSEGASRQTLTAPSPVADTTASAVNSVITDRSTRGGGHAGEAAVWAASHGWAIAADGLVVEGTDTITAVSDACPTKTITIRGVPVALTSATTFVAPLTCASLAVGTSVKVTALLTFTATGFTVTATSIAPASDDGTDGSGGTDGGETPGPPGRGGKKARGEGVVGSITGSCPTLTLIITGTRVSTTETTEYVNGSCESLRPGTKVTIDGALNPGGTATAEKIEIRSIPGRKVSGDGKVDTVNGSCPSLELSVRGVTVTTSGETTFTGGACSDIKPGSQIDVTGDYDGTEVTATAVHIKKK
jgi:hypothetical protein